MLYYLKPANFTWIIIGLEGKPTDNIISMERRTVTLQYERHPAHGDTSYTRHSQLRRAVENYQLARTRIDLPIVRADDQLQSRIQKTRTAKYSTTISPSFARRFSLSRRLAFLKRVECPAKFRAVHLRWEVPKCSQWISSTPDCHGDSAQLRRADSRTIQPSHSTPDIANGPFGSNALEPRAKWTAGVAALHQS